MPWLDQITNFINTLGPANYWLALAVALLESLVIVGAVIPGSIILLIIAALAVSTTLSPWLLIAYASLGSIIGDGISYWLGHKGTKFFKHENKLLKKSHLERATRYFKKHGNLSVFLGRFAGPIRPMIPFVAGLAKMPRFTFYLWNITGAFLWAAVHVFLGYFFGGTVSLVAAWADRLAFIIFITLVVIALVGYALLKSRPIFGFIGRLGHRIWRVVWTDPKIVQMVRRHPKIANFIQKRLTTRSFNGLALTTLVLAFGYVLFLFLDLLIKVKTDTLLTAADHRLANLFFSLRDRETINFFLWVTLFGKWQIVLAGAIGLSLILWLWSRRRFAVTLWLTLIGAGLTDFLAKMIVARPRPPQAYYLEHDFSFPSGHATLAVAFYGFIVFILWCWSKKWGRRVNLAITGLVAIMAIGFSRLYLDVHYLSDVLGGYLIGSLFLIVGIALTLWHKHNRGRRQKTQGLDKKHSLATTPPRRLALVRWLAPSQWLTPPRWLKRHKKIITAAVITAYGLVYVIFGLTYAPTPGPATQIRYLETKNVLDNFAAPPANLPRYTETLLGQKQEPLSLIIVAPNDRALVGTFQKAGWQLADKTRPSTLWQLARAALTDQAYSKAPMSPSFWNALPHDFGFEKPAGDQTVKKRHHARFWRTELTTDGQHVYVGTASLDIGLKWLITHKISPDLDTERELIASDLSQTGRLKSQKKQDFVPPLLGHNFGGDAFFTDGKLYLLNLIIKSP